MTTIGVSHSAMATSPRRSWTSTSTGAVNAPTVGKGAHRRDVVGVRQGYGDTCRRPGATTANVMRTKTAIHCSS